MIEGGMSGSAAASGGRAELAAVLFDMDGLLVDTEPLWTIAEHELAASLGGEFTPEIKAAMIGHGVDTALPLMLAALGRPDYDQGAAARFLIDRVVELFKTPGSIVRQPGATELLDALADAGVPIALVSSSFRMLVDSVLHELGPHRFAATVAGDEVSWRKPHPEPYLRAAKLLDVDPRRCVVLEDSNTGAQAGLDAGSAVVYVPSMPGLIPVPEATTVANLHHVDLGLLRSLVTTAP